MLRQPPAQTYEDVHGQSIKACHVSCRHGSCKMGASLCWAAALPLSLHLACKAEAKVQFVFVQKVLSAVCDATCQKPCRQAVQALTSVCCLCVSAAAWCAALLCFCSSCCSLSDRSALRFCSVAISAAASAAASSASLDCCRRPLNCLQDNNNRQCMSLFGTPRILG